MGKVLPGLPLVTSLAKTPEDTVRILNRLQPALKYLAKSVNFGPVPGAYFPFTFGLEGSIGSGVEQDGQVSPVEFRPVALTVWADTGIVTVDVNANGSSILSSPLISTAGSLTQRGDFAEETVRRNARLTLDIDSVSGSPGKLRVVLWSRQLGDLLSAKNSVGMKLTADNGGLTLVGQDATVTVT